jgi:hypothetical protein
VNQSKIDLGRPAAEEKILADVAERPLDFALRFRAVWSAGAGLEAVMAGKIKKRAVVDDEPLGVFADDDGLHAVIKDLAGRAAPPRVTASRDVAKAPVAATAKSHCFNFNGNQLRVTIMRSTIGKWLCSVV